MSRFSDALRAAMAELDWTQDDFVQHTKVVSRGTVSRYLSGIDVPKPTTLDQICDHLPQHLVRDVTAAYLTDQIPKAAAKQVTVSVVSEGEAASVYHPEKPLPGSHNERVINTLAKAITTDPNLAMVLDYLASAVEGRAPLSDKSGEDLTVMTVEEQARMAATEKELAEQEAERAGSKPKKPVRYTGKKKN